MNQECKVSEHIQFIFEFNFFPEITSNCKQILVVVHSMGDSSFDVF